VERCNTSSAIGPAKGAAGLDRAPDRSDFQPDLQGEILVRKNRAEYPATKERAEFVHDDLMI
jgi:hypothetical protein